MRKRIWDFKETPRQLRCDRMRYNITMKLSKCSISADSLKIFIVAKNCGSALFAEYLPRP
jgi:hypothetical protein